MIYVVEKSIFLNFLDRKEYLKILQTFGDKILESTNSYFPKKEISAKLSNQITIVYFLIYLLFQNVLHKNFYFLFENKIDLFASVH